MPGVCLGTLGVFFSSDSLCLESPFQCFIIVCWLIWLFPCDDTLHKLGSLHAQAFRFMVVPGHCPMISKYGPSLSKAVGLVDPSFLVVKKSHFNKKESSYSESTNSTKQKVRVGSQYSKTCLKQPLKIGKTKILMTNVA